MKNKKQFGPNDTETDTLTPFHWEILRHIHRHGTEINDSLNGRLYTQQLIDAGCVQVTKRGTMCLTPRGFYLGRLIRHRVCLAVVSATDSILADLEARFPSRKEPEKRADGLDVDDLVTILEKVIKLLIKNNAK